MPKGFIPCIDWWGIDRPHKTAACSAFKRTYKSFSIKKKKKESPLSDSTLAKLVRRLGGKIPELLPPFRQNMEHVVLRRGISIAHQPYLAHRTIRVVYSWKNICISSIDEIVSGSVSINSDLMLRTITLDEHTRQKGKKVGLRTVGLQSQFKTFQTRVSLNQLHINIVRHLVLVKWSSEVSTSCRDWNWGLKVSVS